MKIVVGVILGLLLPIAALGIVLATGAFDMSATQPPGALERLVAGKLAGRSVERRAPKGKNPLVQSPEVLRAGLEHYRANCLVCHGAPGMPPGEAGKGLNPPPPDLASPDSQEASDGELYWTVSHGIRMTGMPAWLPTHSEKEIWQLVAFVRHLPLLSPEEKQTLRAGEEKEHHHGVEEGERKGEVHQPAGHAQ
jgi:mono/diheme cytochrome c family protein